MNVALFASGTGSNVQAIIDAVETNVLQANLVGLVCDKEDAPVIMKARKANLEVFISKPQDYSSRSAWEEAIIAFLQGHEVDLIVLAGFMRIIGPTLLEAYPNRIMNIHPSLLPAFPGRQGIEDAYEAQVKETGVTIHWVDAGIDTGQIIAQEKLAIQPEWHLADLEQAIHQIEHRLYPQTIQKVIQQLKGSSK